MFRSRIFFYLFAVFFSLVGCKKDFLSSDKALLTFTIESKNNPALSADINGVMVHDTVTFILPSDTISRRLVPTVTVSPGARVVPGNNEEKDFSQPVLYTVAAPNGTVKNYIVVCKPKTSLKAIVSFKFEKASNSHLPVDIFAYVLNDTIKIRLPEGTSPQLLPVIQVNDGASIVNTIASADFANNVNYTVKAEDGSTKVFTTRVIYVAPPKLKGFMINSGCGAYVKSTDTYYFPVTPGTTFDHYKVTYDTVAARYLKLGATATPYNIAANYPLTSNQVTTIEAYDEFGRTEKHNLIITGLPVVQLKTELVIGDNNVNTVFALTDPDYQAHGGAWYLKSNINIKVRGATSRFYPKTQYAVKTLDDSFNEADRAIMGLREDDSWVLDAMYIDPARMRNRLCTDIWNSMSNVPYVAIEPEAMGGSRGYMTEVFLNNEYLGMYCLTEKVDRKQVKIKKNGGVMYKSDASDLASNFLDNPAYNNGESSWSGWAFEYPELGDSPAPNWKPIYDFVTFVSKSSDAGFAADIKNKVYIDNLVDYLIFVNATAAVDNTAKNCFFSYYDKSKDSKFFYAAWDLDATFGRTYSGELSLSTPAEFTFLGLNNNLFTRLLNTNADGFIQKLKARWSVLKTNQLSKSTIAARMNAYQNRATSSGAEDREKQRWNLTTNFNSEVQFMDNWYNAHYDWLDNYINGL